ncbi:transposase [Saccharolobus islandicus]|uniref:transposase n=1 Tax=Saccharolobus islandicus TaxID=43080 RepID=UPI0011D102B2
MLASYELIGLTSVDNASFHKSSYVLATASRLNINLLFLPPYSLDLNRIEFGRI